MTAYEAPSRYVKVPASGPWVRPRVEAGAEPRRIGIAREKNGTARAVDSAPSAPWKTLEKPYPTRVSVVERCGTTHPHRRFSRS